MTQAEQMKADIPIFTNPDEFGERILLDGVEMNIILDYMHDPDTGAIITNIWGDADLFEGISDDSLIMLHGLMWGVVGWLKDEEKNTMNVRVEKI